jgi:hypothetical protein
MGERRAANTAPSEKRIGCELKAPPSSWIAERDAAAPQIGQKIIIKKDGRVVTFADVITGWSDDAVFRAFFCTQLAAAPYPAFFWEMPPIRRGQIDVPYECMLIPSGTLARMPPDETAFVDQFITTSNSVVTFPNLGGDAFLVAPEQIAAPECYAHLAEFVRTGPPTQQQALFQALGQAIEQFLKTHDRRIWISTSGLGVAWLHIRLDTYPKYYQYQPYALA